MVPFGVIEEALWENPKIPFVAVLDGFHAQKDRRTNHGDQKVQLAILILARLSAANGQGHRQTAEQKNDGVKTTKYFVQVMVCEFKNFGVVQTIQGVSDEQPTEEQNFGHQENPNAQFPGIELLFWSIEVMSDKGSMIVVIMIVIVLICGFGNCHGWLRSSGPRRKTAGWLNSDVDWVDFGF